MSKEKMSAKKTVMNAALSGVMAALVFVATFIIRIPVPATGGYINIGDFMIFISGLLFGPIVGGFAGGVGSALSDAIGYPDFVFITLGVKGIEGLIAGGLTTGKTPRRDTLIIAIAGIEMITGYFIAESYLYGLGNALIEFPWNIFQAVFGAVVAIPVSLKLRKRFPEPFEAIRITIKD